MFRNFCLLILILISILVLWINVKLYSRDYSYSEKKSHIILQLNFLESELKNNNLGERMQEIFPEGFIFVHALYGLSWCELAISNTTKDSQFSKKSLSEALFAYNIINSKVAKQPFNQQLIPENGVFYVGWKNYLLAKILCIDTSFRGHETYIREFKSQCELINNALKISDSPFLESYNSQSWPADMFVAMASLSIHDKLFKPKYEGSIKNWIQKVRLRLDPLTGMIPHKVDSKTGESVMGSRGCSMSLILRMLADIDPTFGMEQFQLFQMKLVSTTLGLPSIREYPIGQQGSGDVDSGPVILGVGFSATISMIGTMYLYHCPTLGDRLYKTVTAFGFSCENREKKKYLFGKLPIADAFIAWGRSTSIHTTMDYSKCHTENWRIKFQGISLLILLFMWIMFFHKELVLILRIKR